MAGVSPATVSNVLTGRKPVSGKLVKKVEAAVKALDYRADPRASMLRSGDAKIIAVLVPDLDNPFFTSIVSAVEQCLRKEVRSHRREFPWRGRGREVKAESDTGVAPGRPGRRSLLGQFSWPGTRRVVGTPYVIADRVTDNLTATPSRSTTKTPAPLALAIWLTWATMIF